MKTISQQERTQQMLNEPVGKVISRLAQLRRMPDTL